MEESTKLDLSSSSCYYGCGDAYEMEQKNTAIASADEMNGLFQYQTDKIDSYVIDMDAFSSGISKDSSANANANSRITRSLSRKGSQRWSDRKVNGLSMLQIHHDNNKDAISALCSPKKKISALCSPLGSCTPDKAAALMAAGSTDHLINTSGATTTTEGRLTRRNSFIRSSSWQLDPKRVLIFFATLSSMGTMLLIYFTLISNKQNADEYVGDIRSSE